MAFGRNKDEAPAPNAGEREPLEGETLDAAPPPGDDAVSEADAPPAAEPAAAAAPAAAEAPGTDALLSMFQSTESKVDDIAVLVDLAGDPDLDDILEELRTLRAALGITDAYDDEELAAA